jgi:hypothetical protein
MPVHMLRSQSEDTRFIDGLPVGFSSFEPSAGTDLLDPPAEQEDMPSWEEIVSPVAARGKDEDEDEDFDDDDDDDLWDDDDDDDDDDDFEEDDEDDFDDDDDDPFTLDDDDDDDL